MSDKTELTPTVLWAQRKKMIIITVKYEPSEKPDFVIKEDYMTFKGEGKGQSGKATYSFELIFYEPMESDKCRVKFSQNEVEFRLIKKNDGTWPRLQSSHERPHWIMMDFEHWEYQTESDDEESENETRPSAEMEKAKADLKKLETEMKKEAERSESITKILQTTKKAYLLIYNGLQWGGFILILLSLLGCLRGGMEGMLLAYEKTGDMMLFCHFMMLFEAVHAMLGLVKSSVSSTTIQVVGRFLMVYVVVVPSVEIHYHPVIFFLFLTWTLIEVVRYPYYALSVLNIEVSGLTWLRYSVWIPLYPLGFTLESISAYLSLEHYDYSDDFKVSLPPPLNLNFPSPSTIIRIALFIIPLIAYNQITYMFAQRKKKLGKAKTD